MNPKLWGESAWKFLHYVTFAYPNNPSIIEKNNYKNFFLDLTNVLPCHVCKENYKEHLKKLPLTDNVLSNKFSLVIWLFNVHNEVNTSLGRKRFNFDTFISDYLGEKRGYSRSKIFVSFIILISLTLFLILILGYHSLGEK